MLSRAVGQFNDMTAVEVWHSATGSVVNVWIGERWGYLRSLYGQFNDMTVCLLRIGYQLGGWLSV